LTSLTWTVKRASLASPPASVALPAIVKLAAASWSSATVVVTMPVLASTAKRPPASSVSV